MKGGAKMAKKETEKTPELENEKWELFCKYIALSGFDKTKAYIKAGYSEKKASQGAYRLFNKKDKEGNYVIKNRIAELRTEKLAELSFDEMYLIETIKNAIERLKKDALKAVKPADRINANKTIIEQTKDFYKFMKLQEMKENGSLTQDEYANMSDEELQAIINNLMK